MKVMDALKEFQLQRMSDMAILAEIAKDAWEKRQLPKVEDIPHPALYTAVGIILASQLSLLFLSRRGRRAFFLTVDTVLAVLLVVILLAAILSLPIGAVYIGLRGSVIMARSLSENFPLLRLLLRPLLAVMGQAAGAAPAGSEGDLHLATATS